VPTNPDSPIDLSSPPTSLATGHKSRHVAQLSNVPFLGRSAFMSRIQQVASQAPGAQFPQLIAFLQFWKWFFPYLRDCFHKAAPYQIYPSNESGVFSIAGPAGEGPLRIAVAADWGTGTLEAETVAKNMNACLPHYTMHLGDVYYMGEACEIEENCLGKITRNYSGVSWPTGSLGSFALMGNHEMYSGGQGFFHSFLPTLGLLDANQKVRSAQRASYFCLETDSWLVLGLDTGYHSGGMPLFTSMPVVNTIPFLNVDARFDDQMLTWLDRTMNGREEGVRKSILLLTHHQPMSSFEPFFKKPVEQLSKLRFLKNRKIVWLYGHEHRLTIYKEHALTNSLKAYPRCIGHGGMPVKVTKVCQPDPDILYYDPRKHSIDQKDLQTKVGYNGHVVLLFEGANLTIEYRDILHNHVLLTETFTPNGTGELQHTHSKPDHSPLHTGEQTSC
jgi:calcineurin-like phosphoesterase family protein